MHPLITKIASFPDEPGVYVFKDSKGHALYIGKATSLRDRVKSYFKDDLMETRGPKLVKMLIEATDIDFLKTDSVLDALVVEAQLIKKHKPFFNTAEKDDKSFNFVVITKEKFPQIIVKRGREIEFETAQSDTHTYIEVFGPFTQGGSLREAMKIIRRIFPYRDHKCVPAEEQKGVARACFNYHIGLCPGVCVGSISSTDYKKIIHHLVLFFEGKKKQLRTSIEKEMKAYAKAKDFEKANQLKHTLFSLNHIQDVSLLKKENENTNFLSGFRIEAYDIAHTSGTSVVGVMTVVENGEPIKSEYKRFKVKVQQNNDVASLKEILNRRLAHPEWGMPSVIVVDGGVGQVNTAKEVLEEVGVAVPVVGVTKNAFHKPERIIGDESVAHKYESDILIANSEAHRFAINYHRNSLRKRGIR